MSTVEVKTVFDIMRAIFCLAFLCYASYTDLKIRRVKNEVWMAMGFIGGILLLLQILLEEKKWEYYLIFVPIAILFASMLIDHEPLIDKGKKGFNLKLLIIYVIGILTVIYQFITLVEETYFYQLLTIPILIVIFYILYQLRVLHGGADAKALMALAIFVPFYPHFFGFPLLQFSSERVATAMELFFPFAFLVLMNSVLFIIWIFLGLLVYNTAKRDRAFPEMLLGYKMNIDEVGNKFVWSMERVVNGDRARVLFPKGNDDESIKKLKEMGVKRIWVTPKIPFIVFLTVGLFISIFIGNIIMGIIGLFG